MPRILVCWVDREDLRASRAGIEGLGPIANTVTRRPFDRIQRLADYGKKEVHPFVTWLGAKSRAPAQVDYHKASTNNGHRACA
jgi:hypothetical protein